MKYIKIILLIAGLFSFFKGSCQQFYVVPPRVIHPYQVLGNNWYSEYADSNKLINYQMNMDSVVISKQVSFGEYKVYLQAIKKDSSHSFYLSQYPDSAITSPKNYTKYIADKKYDDFPAVGITWEAAMNFCKWKTLKENSNGKIDYIYRLPKLSEWLDACNYLESNAYESDFNKNYSDWTMNIYYEGSFTNRADSSFTYDVFYLPKAKDHPRNKRVRAIGDSYLFQRENLTEYLGSYYFTYSGYRHVAFRIVKEYIRETPQKKTLAEKVITYWNLAGGN